MEFCWISLFLVLGEHLSTDSGQGPEPVEGHLLGYFLNSKKTSSLVANMQRFFLRNPDP